ncbi:MAG: secretion system X translation initiation factor [Rhodocyclales bacterium]|nr:secretion system X translation initiation factor [Rhodocyclales bacterium]MBI5786233.1 secretion system X translation initiation factor [Rhodocyclales bacterium]
MKRATAFVLLLIAGGSPAAGVPQDKAACEVAAANLFRAQSWLPPPPPPLPPPAPKVPPLPFVYLGQIDEGDRIAVFLGHQQRTLIVRSGDTIDGSYRVESVTPTGATFLYLPLGELQQLILRSKP